MMNMYQKRASSTDPPHSINFIKANVDLFSKCALHSIAVDCYAIPEHS